MSSPGIELLLRVVSDRVRPMRCPSCDEQFGDSLVTLREGQPQRVVVEIACVHCRKVTLLEVKPEIDGVARIA